jgi:hypothetical protein
MIGEGIMLVAGLALAMTMATFHEYLMWSSVVPAVPWTTCSGVAGDRGGEQLGEPALAGAGVADQEQAAVGGEGDDGFFDQRGVVRTISGRSCGRACPGVGCRG